MRTLIASACIAAIASMLPVLAAPNNNAPQTTKNPQSKKVRYLTFKSARKDIRTEWFDGNSANKDRAVVLILYGSGGLEPTGGFFRQLAESIAKTGRTAVIINYFDRSGIKWANTAQMGAHFSEWLATIKDALSFVEKQPGVDKAHISLLGHSLGAQLALHVAASDKRVSSVVDMAGCFVLPTKSIARMPPVLILHGTADRVVSLSRERAMTAVLRRTNTEFTEHLFKNSDHSFSNVSMEELVNPIVQFLNSQDRLAQSMIN